jgi:hypothetical protein
MNLKNFKVLRVRRVSPLLFMTAFGLAPYPSLAGRPIFLALFWLAPAGFRRFIRNQARPQPCGIIALAHERSRFCARAGALASHPLEISACPVVGGLSTPAGIGQRQPPFLSRQLYSSFPAAYNSFAVMRRLLGFADKSLSFKPLHYS